MDIQKIIASVYFPYGHHGFEQPYEAGKSVEQYGKEFTEATMKDSNTHSAILASLKITEHEEDGSFKRDKEGNRVESFIYRNDELFDKLFKI
jgi:hypothetical protein